jgi:hypothetical protein
MRQTQTVLFFIAATVPTVAEIAAINRLETVYQNVKVRVAAPVADTKYGSKLEPFDFLAGTVPTAYSSVEGATVLTVPAVNAPDDLALIPAVVTLSTTNQTEKLTATKATIENGFAKLTALTEGVTYASSDEAKATVNSSGVVSRVAAGTATITATLTFTGGTKTATCAVTAS